MIAAILESNPVAIQPLVLVLLCALAAIGTVLLLPGRRESAIRGIGISILVLAVAIGVAILTRVAAGRNDPMGLYFWLFSGVALFGALRVVTHRRPVYSALYFVLTVFASAGLFVLLWAEFLAAALVLIYAGAIMVTYVFVIMLAARSTDDTLNSDGEESSRDPIIASAIGYGLMAILLFVIFDKAPAPVASVTSAQGHDLSVRALASYLFRYQLVNLELAGILLTLSMVGAIVIARRRLWTAEEVAPMAAEKYEAGDDNPHSITVEGNANPRQKAYPEA